MAMTAYQPTASQYASAATHLDLRYDPVNGWQTIRISGVRYTRVVSGNSGKVYLVRADAQGCECCWYQRTLTQCSHMLALELAALEDDLTAAPAPAPVPLKDYRSLYPGCANGCGDLVERQGSFCHRCASDEVYQQRIAERRMQTRTTARATEAWL